jgi:hypothetical protein
MFENKILPKSFCRDFIEIRGHPSQIVMYMSLVLGFKPLMDDWIPRRSLPEFRKICNNYGIHLKEDIVFGVVNKQDIKGDVLGKEMITSTSSYGFPLAADIKGGVHVFLSKDKKMLNNGMWYPVIIKGRLIFQPRADSLNYGNFLGYPDCCTKFFRKYNNWNKYSFLYEIYKNSDSTREYPFYCNPFLKGAVYCYIYHMPCSFQCKKTIKLVTSLRKEIKKREPRFIEAIDQHLKMPLLIFYERKIYAFEGKVTKSNEINYSKVYFADSDNSKNLYQELFSQGNRLKLNGRDIAIYRNKDLINTINVPLEKFAPEYPYIIKFS